MTQENQNEKKKPTKALWIIPIILSIIYLILDFTTTPKGKTIDETVMLVLLVATALSWLYVLYIFRNSILRPLDESEPIERKKRPHDEKDFEYVKPAVSHKALIEMIAFALAGGIVILYALFSVEGSIQVPFFILGLILIFFRLIQYWRSGPEEIKPELHSIEETAEGFVDELNYHSPLKNQYSLVTKKEDHKHEDHVLVTTHNKITNQTKVHIVPRKDYTQSIGDEFDTPEVTPDRLEHSIRERQIALNEKTIRDAGKSTSNETLTFEKIEKMIREDREKNNKKFSDEEVNV